MEVLSDCIPIGESKLKGGVTLTLDLVQDVDRVSFELDLVFGEVGGLNAPKDHSISGVVPLG